jgi:hypothetical protein
MRFRPLVERAGAAALALACLGAVCAAADKPPAKIFTDRAEFMKAAYPGGAGSWAGDTRRFERRIVGGIKGGNETAITAALDKLPEVDSDADGIVKLFEWMMPRREKGSDLRRAFAEVIGTKKNPDHMYCDQAVSVMRTILASKGFVSRPVIFEYTDGHGAWSHTFMEVWDPEGREWLWFDPFYAAYSKTHSLGELVTGDRRLADRIEVWTDPAGDAAARDKAVRNRRRALAKQFWGSPKGPGEREPAWALWYVENGETGRRIEYRDPRHYKPDDE